MWGLVSRHHLLLVLTTLMILLAGCGGSSYVVCQSCEEGITESVRDLPNGSQSTVEVQDSQVTIELTESGSSRWEVRSRLLGSYLYQLLENETLVDRLGTKAVSRTIVGIVPLHDGQAENITTELDGQTLQIRFEVDDFGHQSPTGVLVVDRFHWKGEGEAPAAWWLNADRVILSAPEGYDIQQTPRNANRVNDSMVFWQGDTTISGETYVAMTPSGNAVSEPRSALAVSLDVLFWAGPKILVGGFLFALLFGPLAGKDYLTTPDDQPPYVELSTWVRPLLLGFAAVAITIASAFLYRGYVFYLVTLAAIVVLSWVHSSRSRRPGSHLVAVIWVTASPFAFVTTLVVDPELHKFLLLIVFWPLLVVGAAVLLSRAW